MRSDRRATAVGVLGIALAIASTPAPAQSLNDDVRCFLLSSSYARLAVKNDNLRRAATMTSAFFLGRLSGRLSDKALTAAIRAQGPGMSGKEAGPLMGACAARAAAAEQGMGAAVRGARPAK